MKSVAQTQRVISDAWTALVRACAGSRDADELCAKAFAAALAGERRHRTTRGTFRLSPSYAARYFVVKWFLEHKPGTERTALEWASRREDCFLASALRDVLESSGSNPLQGLEFEVVILTTDAIVATNEDGYTYTDWLSIADRLDESTDPDLVEAWAAGESPTVYQSARGT
jgi:hypothetical protein